MLRDIRLMALKLFVHEVLGGLVLHQLDQDEHSSALDKLLEVTQANLRNLTRELGPVSLSGFSVDHIFNKPVQERMAQQQAWFAVLEDD